ncbi:hypothetical protein NK6_8514 [Bradyrhizobium diazoefficiens]|uniref:Uncharacterized protein n=1 Tax=Bradyrhizobium diazoefficiens TaxID=1355477 RepID=A0A0E4BWF3_9BRAD|nr:hypothetical protein NK6_8514 [Bradyrhizobium diazoefficiens]
MPAASHLATLSAKQDYKIQGRERCRVVARTLLPSPCLLP